MPCVHDEPNDPVSVFDNTSAQKELRVTQLNLFVGYFSAVDALEAVQHVVGVVTGHLTF